MRMDQSKIENIVRRRNAKLLANSTRGWSASAKSRLSKNEQLRAALGPASPELVAAMNALDAGMRNHRAR